MSVSPAEDRILTGPNVLTISRLFWAAALFACIATERWALGLLMFAIAAFSDWFDGVWARWTHQTSAFGRVMDPLIDKVMICGAFIYLLPLPESGLLPWMVTVVLAREFLITGIRGYLEQQGRKFGADQWGKWKMGTQCAYLLAVLLVQSLRDAPITASVWPALQVGQVVLLWAMLALTIYSGVQYLWKAFRSPSTPPPDGATNQPPIDNP